MCTWADLGTLPEEELAEYLNQKRKLTVEVPRATQALLDDAEELRRAVSQGRPLEPGDFSAAADAGKPLTDDVERDLVNAGANKLAARVTMLAARLSADVAALVAAAGPVVAAARNHARLVSGGAADVDVALAMARLIQLRAPLDAALLKVSFLAEPSALRLITTTSIAGAPDDFELTVLRIADRLTTGQANLTAAAAATPGTNAAEARERRDALITVMKGALDGDVLPILPPIAKVPETSPLLQPAAAPAADPVSEWAQVREKVARALALFGAAPWKEHRTADAATGADAAGVDPRPESLAPRARLYGTFIAQARPDTVGTFVGFVVDEWAEQRPSEAQQTGIAINYDAPQSEPPHSLLLAEPTSNAPWSIAGAAKIVAHTVALMNSRAVAAQERPLPGTMLPHANQVPGKLIANRSRARIPTTALRVIPGLNPGMDGSFVIRQGSTKVGVDGAGLSEVRGFGKVKD